MYLWITARLIYVFNEDRSQYIYDEYHFTGDNPKIHQKMIDKRLKKLKKQQEKEESKKLKTENWKLKINFPFSTFNFQFKKVPLGTTEILFHSLFFRKKEKQKKLAAADKSAKILSSSLDKNKLASLRQYFCLNRSTLKFLDAISPRRQGLTPKTKDYAWKRKSVDRWLLISLLELDTKIVWRWYDCGYSQSSVRDDRL